VRQQCQLLGSGYYAWRKRLPAAATEPVLPAWQVAARRVFTSHASRYGQRQLRAQLRREGHEVGRQRLRGWLSASGLRALCTCVSSRPRTTQADPQAVAAANKLATWPAATAPNQIWVGDITYLALSTGQWAYLACWRDAFCRRVVGWHVSDSLHTDFILIAFKRAVAICQPLLLSPPSSASINLSGPWLSASPRQVYSYMPTGAASTPATPLPSCLTAPRRLPA